MLALPDEAITLHNGHYKNGRTTGAAILARVKAAGGRVRRAEDQAAQRPDPMTVSDGN